MPATMPLFTRADRNRLRRFIALHEARLARKEEALSLLSAKLESGRLTEVEEVPDDLVTMHSQVRMRDADTGRYYVATASLPPEKANNGPGSLLHVYPKAALLGARVGDDIVWRYAGRLRRARIEQLLFQPESSARRARRRTRDKAWMPVSSREREGSCPLESQSRNAGERLQSAG